MREYAAQLKEQERALDEQRGRIRKRSQRETAALEAELERLRQLQQTQRKGSAFRSTTNCGAPAEEINRANSRISVARLELERLKREEERAHEKRDAESDARRAEGRRARRTRSRRSKPCASSWRAAQTEAQRIGEEHSVLRAETGRRSRSGIAASARRWRGLKISSARCPAAGGRSRGEVQRWGENARAHSERKHRARSRS